MARKFYFTYLQKGIKLEAAPLLIYGYGSYGLNIEPSFKLSFLPLIDKVLFLPLLIFRGRAGRIV